MDCHYRFWGAHPRLSLETIEVLRPAPATILICRNLFVGKLCRIPSACRRATMANGKSNTPRTITRRRLAAGLALITAPAVLSKADKAYAQTTPTMPEKSLYERLGGVFAIATVVNH